MENSIEKDINTILTLMDKNHHNKLSSPYKEIEDDKPDLEHGLNHKPGKKLLTPAYLESEVEYENKEPNIESISEVSLKNGSDEKKLTNSYLEEETKL